MANKYFFKCPTSLAIGKMWIKITFRFTLTTVRMTNIKTARCALDHGWTMGGSQWLTSVSWFSFYHGFWDGAQVIRTVMKECLCVEPSQWPEKL